MRQANKPADSEHPYGHRQLESISAIVVGAFILTTGIAIFWQSLNKIFDLLTGVEPFQSASTFVVLIAFLTLMLKIYLYFYTKKNFTLTKNPTLLALAKDHLNDIMASGAVIVGVIMAQFGILWMDPAAGAIVAIFIVRTGISIIFQSASELMDAVPDKEFGNIVRELTLSVEGVRDIEDLGVHRFGPSYTIEMIIGVDGNITVDEGNKISHKVEERLMNHFHDSLRRVTIHFHPASSNKGPFFKTS
jgi:cation diffusion facilitator family transporter